MSSSRYISDELIESTLPEHTSRWYSYVKQGHQVEIYLGRFYLDETGVLHCADMRNGYMSDAGRGINEQIENEMIEFLQDRILAGKISRDLVLSNDFASLWQNINDSTGEVSYTYKDCPYTVLFAKACWDFLR